jgi:hypothetical protein
MCISETRLYQRFKFRSTDKEKVGSPSPRKNIPVVTTPSSGWSVGQLMLGDNIPPSPDAGAGSSSNLGILASENLDEGVSDSVAAVSIAADSVAPVEEEIEELHPKERFLKNPDMVNKTSFWKGIKLAIQNENYPLYLKANKTILNKYITFLEKTLGKDYFINQFVIRTGKRRFGDEIYEKQVRKLFVDAIDAYIQKL